MRIVAPLLSEWFDEFPTTDAIYAKANHLGYEELHPSAGLHLAWLYVEQPENECVIIGHKPILVPARDGRPRVLGVGRKLGRRRLYGYDANRGSPWSLVSRIAFGVPVS